MAKTTRKKTSSRGKSDRRPPGQSTRQQTKRTDAGPTAWERVAYPDALRKREDELLGSRASGGPAKDRRVGFALSGGGIRSATFCLGVFQGLAKLHLLKNIHYLSTVSGGGYFGGFYGRLFSRDEVENVDDIAAILDPCQEPTHRSIPKLGGGAVMHWLRENGRHLSPNGAGDFLLGLVVMLRNWLALQAVMITALLTLFLALQYLRVQAEQGLAWMEWKDHALGALARLPGGGDFLWWSPYIYVALAIAFVTLVPMWAFWMIRSVPNNNLQRGIHPLIGLGFTAGVALAAVWLYGDKPLPFTDSFVAGGKPGVLSVANAGGLVVVLALLTFCLTCYTRYRTAGPYSLYVRQLKQTRLLSRMLTLGVAFTAMALILALIDSFGQTAYLVVINPNVTIHDWLVAGLISGVGALAAVAAGARKFAVLFSGNPGGKRLGLSMSVISTIVSILLALVVFVAVNAASHAVAWKFRAPGGVTGLPQVMAPEAPPVVESDIRYSKRERVAELLIQARMVEDEQPGEMPVYRRNDANPFLGLATLVAVVLTVLFAWTWPFLNNSSLHMLYTARLIRAYLGGSNVERVAGGVTVTQPRPGDDASFADYWFNDRNGKGALEKGAPLHLVNMTVNETVSGRSQLEQRDRKGVGLALGPAGASASVAHHVLLDWRESVYKQTARVFPADPDSFRMFEYEAVDSGTNAEKSVNAPEEKSARTGEFEGEELTIGQATGISGAAFSTGMGTRTHMGLSFLAAFFNIRTGYWWDSAIPPQRRLKNPATKKPTAFDRLGQWFTGVLPVVSYLIDESLARFHGPLRKRWYLSDGGHFENMGGYELIRRRLPFIFIVDAECDPGYKYEGLSNLMRKARLDFGAEIEFLDEEGLDRTLPREVLPFFGTLHMIRRGAWDREDVPSTGNGSGKRFSFRFHEPERPQYSLAYAALARVTFIDEDPPKHDRWLMYLKPALTRDEPQDLLTYHSEHPAFPHETTGDQFFDEEQWESYRKLGEHIALRVFGSGATGGRAAKGFSPAGSLS